MGAYVRWCEIPCGLKIDDILPHIPAPWLEGTERYRREDDLRRSLCAHLLCRLTVAEVTGQTDLCLKYTAQGAPYIPGSPLFLSMSHSGGLVAAAVSSAPCGVDLEAVSRERDITALCRRYLCPRDTEAVLGASDPALEFTAMWTAREAYTKCTGIPLPKALGMHITPAAQWTVPSRGTFYVISYCGDTIPDIKQRELP